MKKLSFLACSIGLSIGLSACSVSEPTVSNTPSSVSQASVLSSGIALENFDKTRRAQDNFYYHVNGTWLKNTEIPADKSNYGSFTKLADDAQVQLRQIIESASKVSKPNADQKKLGDFYTSYMDEALANKRKLIPLKKHLVNINAINSLQDLAKVSAMLTKAGTFNAFQWYVHNDEKNSSEYVTYLTQGGLGLPDRDYYLSDKDNYQKHRQSYVAYIEQMLTLANESNVQDKAKAILALETRLAEKQWTRVENRDATKTYTKVSVPELEKMLGDFDWKTWASVMKLDNASHVVVRQPSFFEAYAKIFSETPLQTWKTYLKFALIDSYADLLSKEFVDARFAFRQSKLNGIDELAPRWKRAVDASDTVLGELVGKLYVAKHFKPEAKARMEVLVQNLIKAYAVSIKNLDWMTDETKVKALEKLNAFKPKIGYPDKWKDYSQLMIKPDDLVGNFMRHSEWAHDDMADKLGKPIDKSIWHMTPQTVNAYYDPVMNEIVFPAAILQPPFFNLEADDAVNYGGIGAVIGHEIGHGFDDQGAKYDGNGNLRNWWSDADKKAFEARGEKLAAQYDLFKPFEDANVNGKFTLGENIGDLGGLSVAFRAYKLSLEGKKSSVIDGFTGEQRVFLGWAQVWRRNYRETNLRRRLVVDPHSPSEYRVIGVLRNMPEFYKAFDVKKGDEMYLEDSERVSIW